MIYVGANDGMLHAFDDASGGESWAYVPSALYRKPDPPESVGATYPNLLGALAFQEGALPKFKHRFLVDGPITVTDANIAGSWKTMLVGGLGKGGKSFYAVDVTDPANVKTEADAAAALMWEFNDPDLGYSFGKPLVTKTNAFGKKWLVVVSSGYNNPSGEGKLWFLDAKDGTVLKVLSTGVGSAGTPSGLAQFSAYTQDQTNYLADQIYAGDLLGNFWRFDVSDADSGNWKVEKMATLTSPSGAAQPVTTAPQIEIDIANGVDRWVFVGTGKLLHENDLVGHRGADAVRVPRRHDVEAESDHRREVARRPRRGDRCRRPRVPSGQGLVRRPADLARRPADHRRAGRGAVGGRLPRDLPVDRPLRDRPARDALRPRVLARQLAAARQRWRDHRVGRPARRRRRPRHPGAGEGLGVRARPTRTS